MAEDGGHASAGRLRKTLISIVACLILLGTAFGANLLIYSTEPTAERSGATRRSAALVETTTVSRGTYRPRIEVLGTVRPARDILLSPRVSGQVISVSPQFRPGSLIEAGEVLLELDPADFETELAMRQSTVTQIETDLAIERGRQNVARKEFELLGTEIDASNRSLVLREPQIKSILARLAAAEAMVKQAQLNLERTRITAPFDAQVLSRLTDIGSQVATGDELARLVNIDEYWVIATVPVRDLMRLDLTHEDNKLTARDARVVLRKTRTWPAGSVRYGKLVQTIGEVDEQTRLARVLITVDDPLGRSNGQPPLVIGSIIEASLPCQPITGVVRLDRDHLRQNETVWVNENGRLAIRKVTVDFRDAQYAYISQGLSDGDEVVTTTLATVVEGLELQQLQNNPTHQAPTRSE
ncbi:efflux RND transporter periplasmic adaptor subunit [Mucisphaera sp.]|uniref:efflux RND transporter periplasmic adaptor subunit n=1 Tax=Mucisphaera sp. TaxID=2913024 RepID=UPI003D0C1048